MMQNSRIFLSILLLIMLILIFPVNYIISYAQQPTTNGIVKGSTKLNIDHNTFPINYNISEAKVFANYSQRPTNNSESVTNILLGNVSHAKAIPSNSTLIINTNSSIAIALAIEIPESLKRALITNVSSEEVNQINYPVSINRQQIFAIICSKDKATEVFIPAISNNPQRITINLNPHVFNDSDIKICNSFH